jgi:hypothetical protein
MIPGPGQKPACQVRRDWRLELDNADGIDNKPNEGDQLPRMRGKKDFEV